jgi:preprotein translocase subunit SecD
MRLLMFLSGVALALASAASADGLYRWTNADGVVSFSDDLKRIPEAYRASAVAVKGEDLAGYKQFTPAPAAETETYRERLNAHADRMRALNESVAAEQAAAKPAPAQGASIGEVRVSRKLSLAMPEGVQAGAEPIVVEEHRVRDGNATTHIYVVRQGDRVLSVMRPHTNQSDATWQDIEEVIGEE